MNGPRSTCAGLGRALAIVAFAIVGLTTASAQDDAALEIDEGVRFRRALFPADRAADLNLRGRYLPTDPEAFERLVQAARAASDGAVGGRTNSWRRAVYEARLEGESLLVGQATLEIDPAAKTNAAALEPWGLVLRRAAWSDRPTSPATIGIDRSGALVARVEPAESLSVDWALSGAGNSAGAVEFACALPRCAVTTLVLELPQHLIPKVSAGIVRESDSDVGELRRWSIELGSQTEFRLSLVRGTAGAEHARGGPVREFRTYDLRQRGLQLAAEFRLDTTATPANQLELAVDRPMKVVRATLGGKDVAWSTEASPTGEPTRILVAVPQPSSGNEQVLQIAAVAPIVLDGSWTLPTISAVGTSWREATTTVTVHAPLAIHDITPVDCAQSKSGAPASPAVGELVEFRHFTPDARLALFVSRVKPRLEVRSAAVVTIRPADVAASFGAVLSIVEGESFAMEADVAPGWTIDSVNSIPNDILAEWEVEGSGSEPGRLTIRPARALAAGDSLRLNVQARRPRGTTTEGVAVRDLDVLRFRGAIDRRRLLAPRTEESHRLEWRISDQIIDVEPGRPGAAEQALLATESQGLVVDLDSLDPDAVLYRVPIPQGVSAEVQILVEATETQLVESYSIDATPDTGPIDRLLVSFSQARPESLVWSAADEGSPAPVARLLAQDEQIAAGFADWAETWEVVPPAPTSDPIRLRATRSHERGATDRIALAAVQGAAKQRGSIAIEAAPNVPLTIHNQRLHSIPLEPAAGRGAGLQRAAYRYEPLSDSASADAGLIVSHVTDAAAGPAAIVWRRVVETRYEPNGSARYRAEFWIENSGRRTATLSLPLGCEATRIWVDDREGEGRDVDDKTLVQLDPGRRSCTVRVEYITRSRPWRSFAGIDGALPAFEGLPIVASEWTALVPPGYSILDATANELPAWRDEPSWSQRLLGPIGRSSAERRFDPFAGDDWRRLARQSPKRDEVLRRFRGLWKGLDRDSLVESQAGGTATWGQLTAALERSLDIARQRFVIDRPSLSRLGLTAETPILAVEGEWPDALFDRAGVAMLVDASSVALTSAETAATLEGQIEPLGARGAYWVRPGALAGVIAAARPGESADFLSPAAWRLEPPTHWHLGRVGAAAPDSRAGWTVRRFDVGERVPTLRVAHRDTFDGLSWSLCLTVASLVWWLWRSRPAAVVVLLGAIAIVAFWLPAGWLPLASRAGFGGLLGMLAVWLRSLRLPQTPPLVARGEHPSTRSARIAAPAAVALALCPALAAPAQGPKNDKAAPPIYTVFVPTDEERAPTGDQVLVPEALYDKLLALADRAEGDVQGHLIQSADYRATLVRDPSDRKLTVGELAATYELYVPPGERTVRIDLGAMGKHFIPESVLVDGLGGQSTWDAQAGSLALFASQTGSHELEFALRPTTASSGQGGGFDLDLLPIPSAVLTLTAPADAPAIEIPSARGSVRFDAAAKQTVAELGPARRLVVRWQDRSMTDSSPRFAIDKSAWLKIQPGSVLLDVRLDVQVTEGATGALRFAADPRLTALPLDRADSLIAEVRRVAGDPRVLEIVLARPQTADFSLDLKFQLADVSGIGIVRFPQFAVLDADSNRDVLAASLAGGLDAEPAFEDGIEPLAGADFIAAWGATNETPQFAFTRTAPDANCTLATRMATSRQDVHQLLDVAFGPRRIDLRLTADFTSPPAGSDLHHFHLPAELEVLHVLVREDGRVQAGRWARTEPTSLTVFLNGAGQGPHVVVVSGRLPLAGPTVAVPWLAAADVEDGTVVLRAYRRPASIVSLADPMGLAPLEPTAEPASDPDLGRLVGAWTVTQQPCTARFQVDANRPRFDSIQLLSLDESDDAWTATVEYRLNVRKGLVDSLRLEIPANLAGPFTNLSPAGARLSEIDFGKRELAIDFDPPLTGEARIAWTGRLIQSPSESFGVPRVTLRGAESETRYVSLPARVGPEPVAWYVESAEPSPPPPGWEVDPAAVARSPGGRQVFLLTTDEARAERRAAPLAPQFPQVALSDVRVLLPADGNARGLASFDLIPGDESTCSLVVPDGCRLIAVTAGGGPALLSAAGDGRRQIQLGDTGLPRRIDVLYEHSARATSWWRPPVLMAPSLGDLPVRRTMWTIYRSNPPRTNSAEAERRSSALESERARLSAIAAQVSAGSDASSALAPRDAANWYRPWAERLVASRRAIERLSGGASPGSAERSAETEAAATVREQANLAQRLRVKPVFDEVLSGAVDSGEPGRSWDAAIAASVPAERSLFDGHAASLTLLSDGLVRRLPWTTIGLSFAVGFATFAMAWVMRRGIGPLQGSPRAHGIGVALGLCWWLWLSPSALGLVLAAASLVGAIRASRRAGRRETSFVVT